MEALRVVYSIRFQVVVYLGIFERVEAALVEVRMSGVILDLFNHSDCVRKFVLLALGILGRFHLLRAIVNYLFAHLQMFKLWLRAYRCWCVYRYLTHFLRDLCGP